MSNALTELRLYAVDDRSWPVRNWRLLVLLLCAVAAWWGVAVDLLTERILPNWGTPNLSLVQQLFGCHSYYIPAPLVLAAALVIAWRRVLRRGWRPWPTVASDRTAVAMLGIVCVMHLAGLLLYVRFASIVALILLVIAMLLLFGGWRAIRAHGLAIATLGFLMPMPAYVLNGLCSAADDFWIRIASLICSRAFDIPVLADRLTVATLGADGVVRTIVVARLCDSNALLALMVMFAWVGFCASWLRPRVRAIVFLAAVTLACAGHLARIVFLLLQMQSAAPDELQYTLPGEAVSLLLVFLPSALLTLTALMWRRDVLHGEKHSPHPVADRSTTLQAPRPTGVMLGAAVCVAVAASLLQGSPRRITTTNIAERLSPDQVVIDGVAFSASNISPEDVTRATLFSEDIAMRVYGNDSKRTAVLTAIIVSDSARNGVHPPELCMDHNVLAHEVVPVLHESGPVEMGGYLEESQDTLWYTLHTYFYGDRFTRSYVRQQSGVLWRAVSGGEYYGGAIYVRVPIARGDIAVARDHATQAAEQVLERLDLPLNLSQQTLTTETD